MSIDGKRLQYFLTTADLGSLGRAAQVLHIAQPALSRQIRLLEESVNTVLMERTPRGMVLTAAGRSYYQSAKRILEDAKSSSLQAQQIARGDLGHMSLGVSEIYAWHPRVLGALRAYRRESPGLTFTVEAMLSGAVLEGVVRGRLDMALAYTGQLDNDSPLQSISWLKDDYKLAIHTESHLAKRPPRRLADLNGEDFILFRRDQSPRLHDVIIHHFHERGFSPRVMQEGTTHYTTLALVAAGLGCSIMPSSAEARLPQGTRLIRIPDLELRIPVDLVWRKDNHAPVIGRLAQLLRLPPV